MTASFRHCTCCVSRKLRWRLETYETITAASFVVDESQQIGGRADIFDRKRVVEDTGFHVRVSRHSPQILVVVWSVIDRLPKMAELLVTPVSPCSAISACDHRR